MRVRSGCPAKRYQRKALRGGSRADCDRSLDRHPFCRHPFKPERSANEIRSVCFSADRHRSQAAAEEWITGQRATVRGFTSPEIAVPTEWRPTHHTTKNRHAVAAVVKTALVALGTALGSLKYGRAVCHDPICAPPLFRSSTMPFENPGTR